MSEKPLVLIVKDNQYGKIAESIQQQLTKQAGKEFAFLSAGTLQEALYMCSKNRVQIVVTGLLNGDWDYIARAVGYNNTVVLSLTIDSLTENQIVENNVSYIREIPGQYSHLLEVLRSKTNRA